MQTAAATTVAPAPAPLTRWWFGREEAPSALALLTEDALVQEGQPLYETVGYAGVPSFTLEVDDEIRQWDSTRAIRVALTRRTVAQLEARARELILRASRWAPPVLAEPGWWSCFDLHDLPFMTFLYLTDEDGQEVLIAATEPHFLGVVPHGPDGSGILIFNTRGLVRIDTTGIAPENLPAFMERPVEAAQPRPRFGRLESRHDRQKRFRAERKAKALLFSYLSREQKWELRAHDRVTIVGQDTQTYRIHAKYGMNVDRLDAEGSKVETLCVVPAGGNRIPIFDLVLSHKILLEAQITEFMRVANRFSVRRRDDAERVPAIDPAILGLLSP